MICYFGHFQVKLCRSYTALADVLSLFVVLPLMVRTLGFHDMTIVICAVSAHVRLLLDLINSMLVVVVMKTDMGPLTLEGNTRRMIYILLQIFLASKLALFQAAKSLIYFFADQKNVIYTVIFFSIFRCLPILMMMMIVMNYLMILSFQPARHTATAELHDQDCWPK